MNFLPTSFGCRETTNEKKNVKFIKIAELSYIPWDIKRNLWDEIKERYNPWHPEWEMRGKAKKFVLQVREANLQQTRLAKKCCTQVGLSEFTARSYDELFTISLSAFVKSGILNKLDKLLLWSNDRTITCTWDTMTNSFVRSFVPLRN